MTLTMVTVTLALLVAGVQGVSDNEVARCFRVIVDKHFDERMIWIMHWDEDEPQGTAGLKEIGNSSLKHVVVTSVARVNRRTVAIENLAPWLASQSGSVRPVHTVDKVHADNVVLVLDEMTVTHDKLLTLQLSEVKKRPLFRSQSRLVVVLSGSALQGSHAARVVLAKLWAMTRAANVVVAVATPSAIEFYQWFAYRRDCAVVKTIQHVDTWRNGSFQLNAVFFGRPRNLHGCTLYAGAIAIVPYTLPPPRGTSHFTEGVEVRIANALAAFFNFSLSYVQLPKGESPWLIVGPDGKPYGFMRLLDEYKMDLMYFGLRINDQRMRIADPLDSYIEDALVWVVPTPSLVPRWRSLSDGFTLDLWAMQGLSFLFVTVTAFLIASRSFEPDRLNYRSLAACVLSSWGINISCSVPQPRSSLLRAFLAVAYLHSIITTSAYNSVLITLLRGNRFGKPLETPMDAVEAGLVTYLNAAGRNTYNQSEHDMWNLMLHPDRHSYDEDFEGTFWKIAHNKSAMFLTIENTAKFIAQRSYTDNLGNPSLAILLEKFMYFRVTYYVAKGHPMVTPFRRAINRLVEGGIVNQWLKEVNSLSRENVMKSEERASLSLTLDHLQGAFYVLAASLIVSTLVFLAEVVVFRIQWLRERRGKAADMPRPPPGF